MQQSLFTDETPAIAKPVLTADAIREAAKEKWLKEHPFMYNIFRVLKGEFSGKVHHINALYSGYNEEGYPKPGYESNMSVYVKADTLEDVQRVISDAKDKKKHYYICTVLRGNELSDAGIYDDSE